VKALALALSLALEQSIGDPTASIQRRAGGGAPPAPTYVFRLNPSPSTPSSPLIADTGQSMPFARSSDATFVNGSGAVQTVIANVARVTSRGVLMESLSRNNARNSSAFDDSSWGKYGGGGGSISVLGNQATAPDGTLTADLVSYGAISTVGQYEFMEPAAGISASAGQAWSKEVWVRSVSGAVTLWSYYDSGATALGSVQLNVTTTWQRFSSSRVLTSSELVGGNIYPAIGVDLRTGSTHTAQAAQQVYMWQRQAEQSPYPTSGIDTGGVVITRALETLTVAAADIIGASQGGGSSFLTPKFSSATAGSDRVVLSTSGLAAKWIDGAGVWSVTIGGVTVNSAVQVFAADTTHTLGYRYTALEVCIEFDGAETCGSAPAPLSPTGPLYVGCDASGGYGGYLGDTKICASGATPCN
jgi:hypothetical protein